MNTNDPTTIAGRGFGITKWYELFTPRQLLALLTFTKWIRNANQEMSRRKYDTERAKSISTILSVNLDKLAQLNCTLSRWKLDAEAVVDAFGRQALPMVWDFTENVPISGLGGSWQSQLRRTLISFTSILDVSKLNSVTRGSSIELPYPKVLFDAVITDPPYYDNISYAALSDFFYVWLLCMVKALGWFSLSRTFCIRTNTKEE
jgi:putative DNA methylase